MIPSLSIHAMEPLDDGGLGAHLEDVALWEILRESEGVVW